MPTVSPVTRAISSFGQARGERFSETRVCRYKAVDREFASRFGWRVVRPDSTAKQTLRMLVAGGLVSVDTTSYTRPVYSLVGSTRRGGRSPRPAFTERGDESL
jgi:hypothetical protein